MNETEGEGRRRKDTLIEPEKEELEGMLREKGTAV